MPAEGRENPLLKKGNFDAFFREKYLTKNSYLDVRFGEQFSFAEDKVDMIVRLAFVVVEG